MRLKALLSALLVCGQSAFLPFVCADPPKQSHISFAGKWTGTLKIESQDSYRGNNAKGKHTVSSEVWVFNIPPDEKTVIFHRAQWKGPQTRAIIVRKDDHTVRWTESVKSSMSAPMALYRSNGQKIGTGIGLRPDYDATWTMHAISDTTATLLCESNREDVYARITDTRITGTLTKK